MEIGARCELGLCGFICLDLFRLLADRACQERQLPKGSLFYAGQTMSTLQSVSLAGVAMCVSKPSEFTCWQSGLARCSELPIEQHFGHLRSQSASAQLSARSFFMASARQSLKVSKTLNHSKPKPAKAEKPLSDQQLLDYKSLQNDTV